MRACLFRTLKIWSILLLVLVSSITVHHFVRLQLLEHFYEIDFIKKDPKDTGTVNWWWESRNQQGDIEFSNEQFWKTQRDSLNARLTAERAQLTSQVNQMPTAVRDFAARSLPARIINPDGCRRIIRFVCRMIDGYFREWRTDKIIEAQAWGERQRAVYQGKEPELFNAIATRMNSLIEEGRVWTLGTIQFWSMIFSYLSLVTIVMTALALCKSFAYIFARIFLTENEHAVTLGQRRGRVGPGASISRKKANTYILPPRDGRAFFVKPSVSLSGAFESKRIHVPMQLALSRIRHGIWMMNTCVPNDNDETFIEIDQADSLVVLTLNGPSDEWLVQLSSVVAFSEDIQFQTYLSVKLASLVFGRLVHVGVKGTGQVILAVPGGASIAEKDEIFPQAQMIAWKRNARFRIESSLSGADIFLSRVSVAPSTNDACVKDLGAVSRKERLLLRVLGLVASPI